MQSIKLVVHVTLYLRELYFREVTNSRILAKIMFSRKFTVFHMYTQVVFKSEIVVVRKQVTYAKSA